MTKATRRTAEPGHWWAMVALTTLGPMVYGIGLLAASVTDRFVWLPPIAAVLAALGAVLFLFAAPWLFGTLALRRGENRRSTAGVWSLILNSVALIVVCLVLRNSVGLRRDSLLAVWLVWTVLLATRAGKPSEAMAEISTLARRWGASLAIGLFAVVIAMGVFHREHFIQCFNGDGTETYQLARSLQHHFLPYWEIETTGRFGAVIVNPSLVNSYWTCALQLLLGETESATRLPFWIWWLGVFAVAMVSACPSQGRAKWLSAIPLALFVFLAGIWYTFYVGYYPYMADPANPGVPDALYTLLLLSALYCLRQKDLAGSVAAMAMASLVLYAGPVMSVLAVGAALGWQPVSRVAVWRTALTGSITLLCLMLGYLVWGWLDGSLPGWRDTIRDEYINEFFTSAGRLRSAALYAGYFLLGCGGIPAVALFCVFWRRDASGELAWDRTVATLTLGYLLIVLGSGYQNLHYLGPLLPIPLILWLRRVWDTRSPATRRWGPALLATAGLAVSVVLSWPASRPVFTLNRELGAVTTFRTDSYQEACGWGSVSEELHRRGDLGWQIGRHTWVDYSQRCARPDAPRPFVVSNGEAPSTEYQLIVQAADGVKLYGRDEQISRWAARQRPPAGPDRCPWVFRPIAIVPSPICERPAAIVESREASRLAQ